MVDRVVSLRSSIRRSANEQSFRPRTKRPPTIEEAHSTSTTTAIIEAAHSSRLLYSAQRFGMDWDQDHHDQYKVPLPTACFALL
jgi:hypothetical protein